jgi:prepilin-type processing-associated H-X9-DG protein
MRFSLALLLGTATCANAHHSTAIFDHSKTETISGTVRKYEWANPHVWIFVSVPQADGSVINYGFESGAPVQLRARGITYQSFRTGDRVTITMHPLKNGQNGGQFITATFADGHVLKTPDPAAYETPGAPPTKP